MDLEELTDHAKAHGKWEMQLTARDVLVCEHHRPRNSEGKDWDDFAFFLNGKRCSLGTANAAIERALGWRMGMEPADVAA